MLNKHLKNISIIVFLGMGYCSSAMSGLPALAPSACDGRNFVKSGCPSITNAEQCDKSYTTTSSGTSTSDVKCAWTTEGEKPFCADRGGDCPKK